MIVEVKITTWERWELHGDIPDKNEIIEALDMHPGDLFNICEAYIEKMDDCDEYMMPENNSGYATIELFENKEQIYNGNPIWSNKINKDD